MVLLIFKPVEIWKVSFTISIDKSTISRKGRKPQKSKSGIYKPVIKAFFPIIHPAPHPENVDGDISVAV